MQRKRLSRSTERLDDVSESNRHRIELVHHYEIDVRIDERTNETKQKEEKKEEAKRNRKEQDGSSGKEIFLSIRQ